MRFGAVGARSSRPSAERPGLGARSAPGEAINARSEAIEGGEGFGGLGGADVPPGDGHAESGLGLVEGAARRLEAEAGIARGRAERFGDVESDAAERAAYLGGEVAIAARNGFDERPRELDGVKDLVEELLSNGVVHALPPAQAP